MFIIAGINTRQKELDYNQTMICDTCGQYGRYIVFMTYTFFSIFFIPIIKWNKKYYVQTSCCQSVYELNPEVGKQIERQNPITIQQTDLHLIKKNNVKVCPNCGYTTEENYEYCPKCGNRF